MDIYQLIGDMLHLVAMLMLVLKIIANRNVVGLSYRTQQLFFVVFIARYFDVLFVWRSVYLFLMKVAFLLLTAYTIYLMRFQKPFNLSYDRDSDSFPHYLLYVVAVVLALVIHKSFSPVDFIWSFSIWLEAIAILPQLLMINRLKDIENITAHYVLFLGMYRIFYIFHWILNWENVIFTSFIAGALQSLLYADFIYYFFKSNYNDRIMEFPI